MACGVNAAKGIHMITQKGDPMSRINSGLIAGFDFGMFDIFPMFFMDIPDRKIPIVGAFPGRLPFASVSPTPESSVG
jgi:hypothetical protein